ncbi:MAG: right-handed parallel beta-helix repeat-containing protein [Nitrospira sp.]|nr:right-handed parallel beta-helix repeat-containing protein [Nitrospira sp.]
MAIHQCTAQAGWQGLADLFGKAAAGDEIHLEAGTYRGTTPLSLPSGVRLIGTEGVMLRQDGEGPILTITGSDCHLSKITFISTREDQNCVQITDAERVLVSECVCDGEGVALTAFLVAYSRQITIQSCKSRGFKRGIVILDSSGEVIGNRCCDNTQVGITFANSTGHIEANECWGSKYGIMVHRIEKPSSPSDLTLVRNCCHNNRSSGIAFSGSTGRLETNDCWGNAEYGIGVTYVSKAPNRLEDITLVGNRCHDNHSSGIAFFSNTGRVETNECWANTKYGIEIQRDNESLDQPADVTVASNRCYSNLAGIGFYSSAGRAEANECWGNKLSGIVVLLNPDTPDHLSDVTLVGNRCYSNLAGIGFSRSTGRAEANECWSNQHNDISPEEGSDVIVQDHRTLPSQSPKDLRKARLVLHPLGAWLTTPSILGDGSAEPLADFLHSGGCPDCFTRFWTGDTQPTPLSPPTDTSTAVQSDDRIRTYEVRPSQNQPVTIYRTTVPPGRATAPQNGLEGLAALMSRFSDLVMKRTSKDLPLRWAVGFISAEPTKETTFQEWLEAAKTHAPDMDGRYFDCARYGPDSGADLLSKLEQALVAPYRTWWQRFGARLEALLFMPARECFLAGATLGLLSLLSVVGLALTFGVTLRPLPESGSAVLASLAQLSTTIRHQWTDHVTIMGTIGGAWILVPLFLWNRNLPRSLHVSLTFLMAAIKAIAEIGPIKEVLQATPLKRLGTFIQSHICSQTSRRFWLRQQLYGYRLFDRIRPGAPPPRLIALLHVDVPTQADLEDMRLLLEICPKHQPVMVITQMSGLSMLTSAYLDVWFSQTATASTRPPTAYILHDLDAGRIQPLPDPGAIPTQDDAAPILESLDQLLGWTVPEHGSDQRHEVRTKYGNTLILPPWSFQEFLLALVIGSTPYTHMMVQGRYTASSYQYQTGFLDALTPYLTVLELDRESAQLDLTASEPCIERGKALLPVKVGKEAQLWWVGRGGYRRALADLVRQWYAYCATHMPSTNLTPDDSEPYLAHLLICGELYNLMRLTVLIETPPSSSDLARNHQLLPLHMEAACALVEERLALSREPAEPSVLVDQWQSVVTQVLRRDGGLILEESQRARLCAMYLKATALYRSHGRNELGRQEEEDLNATIAQPFHLTEGTTLWAAFCRDVATLLRRLAYRETATADALLATKLTQEWAAFPETLKETLRNQCASAPRDWLEELSRQPSPDALFNLIEALHEHPALVVGGLSRLAVASIGIASSESDRTSRLIQIADAVLRLRRAAGDDASSVQLDPWKQFPTPEAISAATTLLCDEAWIQRLCRTLEDGAASRESLRRATEHLTCPIEGIALGVHGHLHKVLELAKEADEITVMGSAGIPNQNQVVV